MAYNTLVLSASLLFIGCTLSKDRRWPKIWYGDNAQSGEFPFMVSLEGDQNHHFCGGSLIEPQIVLTVAHCVVDDMGIVTHPSGLLVKVGALDLSNDSETSESVSVSHIVPHPEYNSYTIENDIALVFLEYPVNMTDKMIGTIDLPENYSLYAEGTPITVIGWGGTEDGVPDILQKHEYTISNQTACNQTWSEWGHPVYPGMICTGIPPLEGHSWFGDSGGPLFTEVGGNYVLLALTSWGDGDPSNYTYDVNTDVWYFKNWITETIDKANRQVEFRLLGGDESSHGIVVYDYIWRNGTICKDYSMGSREVNALCHYFGYEYGITIEAQEYAAFEKKGKLYWDFDMPKYAASKIECHQNSANITNKNHCHFEPYPGYSPCFDGDQLAIRCADIPWHFKVTSIDVSVKTMTTGYVKGKVSCEVEALKYGSGLDMSTDVMVYLLDVTDEDDVEYVKTLKWNKKEGIFRVKLKTRDYVTRGCFICYAELVAQDDFYAMVWEESCGGHQMAKARNAAKEKLRYLKSTGGLPSTT